MKAIWESWPEWLVKAISDAYKQGISPVEIGAVLKRSEGVVRSKLVREGVYISIADRRKTIRGETQAGF